MKRPRIGEYEVLAKINSGGMGDVLLVRRSGVHGFEKLSAIKVVRSNIPNYSQMRTMFLDEARLMARLNHPVIAHVYDFGEEGGCLYLVMEYITGISFDALISHRPPPEIAARAMADVLLGLHAAHRLTDLSGTSLGVVHRDVSPQNLMLTFDGCVKILDFGIALMRDRETQATQCGQIKGKPAYMAPEQFKSQPIDPRTDIFTASIVLYELLTGHRLFVGDNIYAVAKAIEESIIVPPSNLVGLLPSGIDDVVMRGLDGDPDRRFQSAQAKARALATVVARTGGESLEHYVTDALAQDRIAHLEWLQKVISGVAQGMDNEAPGRPDGVETAPLKFTSLTANAFADEVATMNLRPPEYITAEDLMPRRRIPRAVLGLGLVLLLAVLSGAIVWYLWDQLGGSENTPTGTTGTTVTDSAGEIGRAMPATDDIERTAEQPATSTTDSTAEIDDPEDVVLGLDLESDPLPEKRFDRRSKKPKRKIQSRRRRSLRPRRPKEKDPKVSDGGTTASWPAKTASVRSLAFGFVTIAADPYANVKIDGKQVGTTPIFRHKLPVGKHEIVLISPDSGKVRLQRTVDLAEDEHEKVILH